MLNSNDSNGKRSLGMVENDHGKTSGLGYLIRIRHVGVWVHHILSSIPWYSNL